MRHRPPSPHVDAPRTARPRRPAAPPLAAALICLLLVHGARAQDGAAQVMAYSDGPFQDNYTATVLAPFNAANKGGPQAQFSPSQSSATMLGALRTQRTAPQTDVVIMDTTTAAIACAEGLVEPVTPAMLPMLPDLDPRARSADGCGPGVTFDRFVIAYDARAVTPAPTSLAALSDPRWKGRVALSAPPNIQALALTAIEAQAHGGDWQKADGAFRALVAIAPNVQTFDPQPDAYTLILGGTLTFGTGWNARTQLYRDRSDGRIAAMFPSEGTVLQINTINLVKGAPHRDAAIAFMRYALSPAAQSAFAARMFYAPTNAKAAVSPAVAERLGEGAPVVPVDWGAVVRLRETWTQRWRREVIPAGSR